MKNYVKINLEYGVYKIKINETNIFDQRGQLNLFLTINRIGELIFTTSNVVLLL